jgi:alpha-beta hydrolase superfamily lysophospholipase
MLVLGAARDGIIAAAHVHRTARAYGTRAEIFDGMGHDMMLEPGWQRVADRIDAWVS